MGRRTLPGSRVELSRAGMTAAIRNVLMQASLQQSAAEHAARRAPGDCGQRAAPAWFDQLSRRTYHGGRDLLAEFAILVPCGGVAQMVRAMDS